MIERNDPVDFDQAMDNFVRLNNIVSDFDLYNIDTSVFLNSLVMDIHPLTIEYFIPSDFVPIEVQEQVQNQVESLSSWILGMFNNLLNYEIVNNIWNEMLTIDYNDALNIVLFSLGVSVVFYSGYMIYTGVYYVYRMVTYPFFILDEFINNSANSVLQLINWFNQPTNHDYSDSSYLNRLNLLLDRLLGPVDDPEDNLEIEHSPEPRFLPDRDMENRFLNHIREYYHENRTNLIELDEDNIPQHVLTYVNRQYDNINRLEQNNVSDRSRDSIISNNTQTNSESINNSVTSLDRQTEADLIMLYERNNLEYTSDSESTNSNSENSNNDLESISSNIEGFIRSRQNSNGTILTNPDGIVTNDNFDALREYILTLRNFDVSSESSISQQIQLYTIILTVSLCLR